MVLKLIKCSWPILVIVVSILMFFWQTILKDDIFVVGDFSGSDLLEMQLPHKYFLHESFVKGEWPLWSPYNGTGFPVHAEGQGGYFYPVNWILVWMEPYKALNYSILIAFLIAGVGTYYLAISLEGFSRRTAILSALVFMFSAFFIARLKHLNMIAVGCWLPWSLLMTRQFLLTGDIRKSVWLGVIWAMMILAGHPQMTYYIVLITLWWLVVEYVYARFILKCVHSWRSIGVGLLTAILLSLGLGAVQILPSLELIGFSYRATGGTFESATAYPLNPVFLLSFFDPYILGNPAVGTYPKDISFWGVWWENVLYVGLLPVLTMVGMSLYLWKKYGRLALKRLKRKEYYHKIVIIIGGLMFLYISLGRSSVLYLFLYYGVPGMQLFRFPQRFDIFVFLAMSLLFGWIVQYWQSRLSRTRANLLFVIVIAMSITDLYFFAHRYIGFTEFSELMVKPEQTLMDTKRQTPPERIYSTMAYVENPYLFEGWKGSSVEVLKVMNEMSVPGNLVVGWGLHSFSDRDWFEGGLDFADLSVIEWRMLGGSLDVNTLDDEKMAKLLGMWNVKYLQTVVPFRDDSYKLVSNRLTEYQYYPEYFIYQNKREMPRAFLVQSSKSFTDKESLIDYMFSNQFDPEKETLLLGESNLALNNDNNNHRVEITKYENRLVEITAEVQSKSVLILSDLMYPGWSVELNGMPAEELVVNSVQRGVLLDVGINKVKWQFWSNAFYTGLLVSSASIIIVMTLLFLLSRKATYEF